MRLGLAAVNKLAAETGSFFPDMYSAPSAAFNAAAGSFGGAQQYQRYHGQGAYQTPGIAGPGAAGAAIGTRDIAKNALIGALGPVIGGFALPFLEPFLAGVPNNRLVAGRVNMAAARDEKARVEALNLVSNEDFRDAFAGDVQRLLEASGAGEWGTKAGEFLRSMSPEAIGQWKPIFGMLTAQAPGLFTAVAEPMNYARIARSIAGGGNPSGEQLKEAKELFDQYQQANVFPEAATTQANLEAMVIAAETGDLTPERVQGYANAIDTIFQAGENAVPESLAANMVRLGGDDFTSMPPERLASIGQMLGTNIQAGHLTPAQLQAAAQQGGTLGVVHAAHIAELSQGAHVGKDPRAVANYQRSMSYMFDKFEGGNPLALTMRLGAGDKRFGSDVARAAQLLNSGNTEQGVALLNRVRSQMLGDPNLNAALTSGNVDGTQYAANLLDPQAYQSLLVGSAIDTAVNQGAHGLAAAYRNDPKMLEKLDAYMRGEAKVTDLGLDAQSVKLLSDKNDPRWRALLSTQLVREFGPRRPVVSRPAGDMSATQRKDPYKGQTLGTTPTPDPVEVPEPPKPVQAPEPVV